MMHRRRWNASRKTGFESTVSAIALMVEKPILMSLAQYGTSPHRIRSRVRDPAFWSDRQAIGRRDIPTRRKIGSRILRWYPERDLDLRHIAFESRPSAHVLRPRL